MGTAASITQENITKSVVGRIKSSGLILYGQTVFGQLSKKAAGYEEMRKTD